MSTDSKKSIREIILLAIAAVIVSGSTMFGFLALGNLCSRLITDSAFYPSSWRLNN